MGVRNLTFAAVSLALCACASAGPPNLGYGVPATAQLTYAYGDTTTASLSVMGQSMTLALAGEAAYGVRFAPEPDGVRVTMSVQSLSGAVSMPMAPPQTFDGSDVTGDLEFSLDRRGDATIHASPDVSLEASRMISGLTTAHTFFPGLPARPVAVGDQWSDTVSYEGDAEAGSSTEHSVIEYTVVGDTVVSGRTLTKISLRGTTEISNSMNMGGMTIEQSSEIDLEGHVLWDAQDRLMFEMVRTGTGRGTVRVPIAPVPLPMEVTTAQRVRLSGG